MCLVFQSAFANPDVRADFNGDGYDDLALGIPDENVGGIADAGAIQVLYGSASGISTANNQFWHLDSAGVQLNAAAGDHFGSAIAAGDFNNDSFADLAVGIPFKNNTEGQVLVLYGSAAGLTANNDQVWDQAVLADTPENDDRFGSALTAGDFNADGFDDLAIGVPGEDFPDVGPPQNPGSICQGGVCLNAGIVNLIFGGSTGLKTAGNDIWHQDRGVNYDGWVEVHDCFGSSLEAADFDGNGADDLAVGVPCEHTGGGDIPGRNQGAVSVYYGTPGVGLTGNGAQYLRQWGQGVVGFAQANDAFGHALAAGDFNNDGNDDLAIGVPGEEEDINSGTDAGAVAVFYGRPGGGLSASNISFNELWHRNSPGILGIGNTGARWGWSLAAGDFDNDGFDDIAVGGPLDNISGVTNAGSVSILYGSASRITSTGNQLFSQDLSAIDDTAEQNDWFAYTLIAGDFNNDNKTDLAIGTPYENVGGIADAGAVNILYGVNGTGLSTTNAQFSHQNSTGMNDTSESQDHFSGRLVPRLKDDPWSYAPPPDSGGNQPPIIDPIGSRDIEEGVLLIIPVSANDADGPPPLLLTATGLPAAATFVDFGNGNGEFNWIPPAGASANNPYNVTFNATEDNGNGQSSSETVTITVLPPGGGQSPFGGSPWPIPGQIEMEDYDLGGEGIAYHDTSVGNTGNVYRTDNVDIWLNAIEGYYTGANKAGEWLEFTVDVVTAGSYQLELRFATPNDNRSVHVEFDGVNVSGPITLPSTGGWQAWQTLSLPVTLNAGQQIMRLAVDGNGMNLNWIRLTASGGGDQPPVLNPIGAQTIEEGLTLNFPVTATDDGPASELRLTATGLPSGATFTDNGNGNGTFDWTPGAGTASPYNVTFTVTDLNGTGLSDSEMVQITVTVPGNQAPVLTPIGPQTIEEGLNLNFPVSATDDGPTSELRLTATGLPSGATFIDNGNGNGTFDWTPGAGTAGPYNVTFSVTDLNGTGLSDSEMVQIVVTLPGGGQSPFGGIPWTIPGQIELEDYDLGGEGIAYHDTSAGNNGSAYRTDDVDIWLSVTEGYFTGSNKAGEWLEFTVDVASTGNYQLELRFATPNSNRNVHVELDGVNVSGPITLPNTGGWQTWQTLSVPVTLNAGQQIMRLAIDGNGMNLNWIRLTASGGGNLAPVLNPIGPQTIEEGLTLNFPVSATDDGPDSELQLTVTGLPSGASFTDNGNGNGTFNWIPATGTAGPYNVTFTVTDLNGTGLSDSEMVQIIVTAPGGGQSPFGGIPWTIPGQIEMEDYDLGGEGIAYHDTTLGNKGTVYRSDDVDIWQTVAEGYFTGANRTGEWLEFTVDVASAGDYLLELRFATPKDNRRVHVDFDGVNVSGTILLPNTGDWQAWQILNVPVTLNAGQQIMRLSVDDNGMNLNWIRFTQVGGNQAPSITSTPVTTATEGQLYSYDVAASDDSDSEGAGLSYSLDLGPVGMSIDTSSGLIQWTPANTQLGDNTVTVRVTDSGGLADTQSFTVTVIAANQAPTITSTPVTTATEGQLYSYDVEATDPDVGDTLTFSLDLSPTGMSIDPNSGLIQWTPANTQLGDNSVTVRVSDGGLADTQSFTVSVVTGNQAPSITSTPATTATEGQLYSYDVEATDPDVGDTLTFSLDLSVTGMSIDPNSGLIQWTPANTQLGDNQVTVSVRDNANQMDSQSFMITVVTAD